MALQVYPNPMTDDLYIRGDQNEILNCDVMTVSGSLVATIRGRGEVIWSRRDSRGETVPSGLYLLVVTNHAGRSIHKVIVR